MCIPARQRGKRTAVAWRPFLPAAAIATSANTTFPATQAKLNFLNLRFSNTDDHPAQASVNTNRVKNACRNQ
jgi:hypothetical protein